MPYEVRYSDEANKGVIIVEDSLINKGVLCLGSKETLQFSNSKDQFNVIDKEWRVYQLNKNDQLSYLINVYHER